MHSFDIYFQGKLMPDTDPAQVRSAVGALFKIEGEALERLFSGTPVRIKQDVDVEAANRFRAAFRKAGALIDIVPHGQPAPQPEPQAASGPAATPAPTATEPPSQQSDMSLLPPRSGSLEDCAPQVETRAIPDTDWMKVDAPGTQLDETPQSEPLQVDTSGMTLLPANSGSLDDCADNPTPRQIPDISHMQLADGDSEDTD